MNKPKIVLSLFDGISCGNVALERAGIGVDIYYASEIDKQAIEVAQKNYPNTLQLGSVCDISINKSGVFVKGILISSAIPELLIGGSPCQGFSSSGKGLNFEDPRSALFFEYVRILKEIRVVNPNILFLLENVGMKKEHEDVITKYLEVEPILINSNLVSAQNRKRLYWTNIQNVDQPVDRGISLESIVMDSYKNSAAKRTRPLVKENHRKSLCLEVNGIGKSMCLVTVNLNNLLSPLPKGRYIDAGLNDYPHRVMYVNEMERLQTLPDNYVGSISQKQGCKITW